MRSRAGHIDQGYEWAGCLHLSITECVCVGDEDTFDRDEICSLQLEL